MEAASDGTYLNEYRLRLGGVVEDESLQVLATIAQLEHNVELVVVEELGMVVVAPFGSVIAIQFPLVDQMLRVSASYARDSLHIHKSIGGEIFAVAQVA